MKKNFRWRLSEKAKVHLAQEGAYQGKDYYYLYDWYEQTVTAYSTWSNEIVKMAQAEINMDLTEYANTAIYDPKLY